MKNFNKTIGFKRTLDEDSEVYFLVGLSFDSILIIAVQQVCPFIEHDTSQANRSKNLPN